MVEHRCPRHTVGSQEDPRISPRTTPSTDWSPVPLTTRKRPALSWTIGIALGWIPGILLFETANPDALAHMTTAAALAAAFACIAIVCRFPNWLLAICLLPVLAASFSGASYLLQIAGWANAEFIPMWVGIVVFAAGVWAIPTLAIAASLLVATRSLSR